MYTFITRDDSMSTDTSQTIRGDKFQYFLELCFNQADYFSLMTARWANSVKCEAREELQPFLKKQFETKKWFGYDFTKAPPNVRNRIEIQVYKAIPETKSILLKYFADIFLNEERDGILVESVQDLEDLCFFSKQHVFVTSVSHAELLWVHSDAKDIVKRLDTFGNWR